MTIRDPYTGVETAARPPRSFRDRWWPALVIAAIFVAVGIFEWQHARSSRSPHSVPTPLSVVTQPAAPQAVAADDLTRATAALTNASDQLAADSELLIGIAALQVIVLAGQLYWFGQQRRAARGKDQA